MAKKKKRSAKQKAATKRMLAAAARSRVIRQMENKPGNPRSRRRKRASRTNWGGTEIILLAPRYKKKKA